MRALVGNEVRVFSLKRSGTNAIAHWLFDCYSKKYSQNNGVFLGNTDFSLHHMRCLHGTLGRCRQMKRINRLISNNSSKITAIEFIINSIENYNLSVLKYSENDPEHIYNIQKLSYLKNSGREKFSKAIHNVVVLRSPQNHLASIFRMVENEEKYKNYFMVMILDFERVWTQYAKEFISETNYVKNKIPVLYDKWFAEKKYREEICNQLGLSLPYEGLSAMAVPSSFDGTLDDPSVMNVSERWKEYRKNGIFCSILKDQKLQELYEIIFNEKLCV